MIDKRLRDEVMLEYAAHAFDDCWKLSLNILYFCSKSSKKLYYLIPYIEYHHKEVYW